MPRLNPAVSQPADITELLHPLALHLGGVDVALAVDAEIVEVFELAGIMSDAPERGEPGALLARQDVELRKPRLSP